MVVRAVLFDLGHTLWDIAYDEENLAPALYEKVRARLVKGLAGPVPEAPRLREAVEAKFREKDALAYQGQLEQAPFAQVVEEGLRTLGLALPQALLKTIAKIMLDPDLYQMRLDSDPVPVLRALKERGLRLGVISNTYYPGPLLRQSLAGLGLLPYLDSTVFSSDAGVRKPHPAIFWRALEELKVRPEEAVFVGDSVPADIWGANALGMRTVLAHQYRQENPEWGPPDHVIERLEQIIDYVDRLR